jgi:hypothetical protein
MVVLLVLLVVTVFAGHYLLDWAERLERRRRR